MGLGRQPWPSRCNHPELQATHTSLAIAGLTCLLFPSLHPTQLLQNAPKLEKRLPDYCAVSTFVYLLTTKGYSFNNHSFPNIAFQKKVGSTKNTSPSHVISLELSQRTLQKR